MTLAKSSQFRKSDPFQVCEKSQLVAKCGKENTAFLPASARGEIKGCPAEAELGHLATLHFKNKQSLATIGVNTVLSFPPPALLFTSSPLQISLSAKFLGRDR